MTKIRITRHLTQPFHRSLDSFKVLIRNPIIDHMKTTNRSYPTARFSATRRTKRLFGCNSTLNFRWYYWRRSFLPRLHRTRYIETYHNWRLWYLVYYRHHFDCYRQIERRKRPAAQALITYQQKPAGTNQNIRQKEYCILRLNLLK